MTRRYLAGCLALTLFTATGGCGGNPSASSVSGSTEEVTLKGTVRVRGKAVNNGRVTFRTSNINRPNAPMKDVEIGKDGSYAVTTLVGQNFVEVSCKETLGPKNRDLIENEQMIVIQSGQSTLDIDIPPQAPAAK